MCGRFFVPSAGAVPGFTLTALDDGSVGACATALLRPQSGVATVCGRQETGNPPDVLTVLACYAVPATEAMCGYREGETQPSAGRGLLC